jgi:hypothetical protein
MVKLKLNLQVEKLKLVSHPSLFLIKVNNNSNKLEQLENKVKSL